MVIDRLYYELRLLWKALVLAPLAALALVAVVVALDRVQGTNAQHILLAGIEMLLPTVAAMVVAVTLASDDALELHLTMPRHYDQTAVLRLLLISGWIACLTTLWLDSLLVTQQLTLPTFTHTDPAILRVVVVQGLWFAPLLWLSAVGFLLAALTRSRTISGAALGGLWLLEIVFAGTLAQTAWLRPLLLFPATLLLYPAASVSRSDFIRYWLDTRLALIATALVFMAAGWLLLRNPEHLLKGVTAE